MINNNLDIDGGQIGQPQTQQISAKEFAAKFKSKRGEYMPFRVPLASGAKRFIFGGGHFEWQVTPGSNLYRRETSDLISFFFRTECYNFLASDCDVYLPPYGKWSLSRL